MTINFSSEAPDTMVDHVYHQIKKDIIEDFLRPGEKINPNVLCSRYGVSQTPIKQALNRLMVEGLVEGIPRKGCKVRRISWSEIDEIFELRLMMELHFSEAATRAVGSNTVLQSRIQANLQRNLELVKRFTTPEEYFQIYQLDQEFHDLFIASSGNQAAMRTYRSLNTHTYAAYLFDKQPKNKTIEGILEHEDIYKAMLEANVQEVRRRITVHNENARNKIQITLKVSNLI